MSCSVNLVPIARMHTRARVRRRSAWLLAGAASTVLLATAWSILCAATGAVDRLSAKVQALETQRADVQRRLVTANARRTQLLEQLHVIANARRPQPWARRLTTLTREAPPGVLLTELNVTPSEGVPPASPQRAIAATAEGASASAGPTVQAVQLRGYAVDHAALIQLLNTLRGFPDWPRVELVRATLEPYRSGLAVAFEFDCRTQESQQ